MVAYSSGDNRGGHYCHARISDRDAAVGGIKAPHDDVSIEQPTHLISDMEEVSDLLNKLAGSCFYRHRLSVLGLA